MKAQIVSQLIPLLIYILLLGLHGTVGITPLQAQDSYPLPPELVQHKGPSAKIQALLHWTDSLKSHSPYQALYYADLADSLSLQYNERFTAAQSAYWLAWINHFEGRVNTYQSALTDAQICLSRLRNADPPFWRARAHALLAAIHFSAEQIPSAKLQLKKAKHFTPQIRTRQDSLWVSAMLHTIQAVVESSNPKEIKGHFLKAAANYRAAQDPVAEARAYRNLALYFFEQGETTVADQYFQKAISLFRQNHCVNGLRRALLTYGYRWTEAFDKSPDSIAFFNKALALTRKTLQLDPDLETYFQMGYIYHQHAFANEKKASGKLYLDSIQYYYYLALGQVTNSNDFDNIQNLAKNLDRLTLLRPYKYSPISDLIPAYDKLLSAERKATERAKWRVQVNEQAKYKAIAYQNASRVFAVLIILAGITIYFFYRSNRRYRQTYTQLQQTRIKPHFISNSLNSINALINLKNNQAASEYLVKFNRFCRDRLDASDQLAVSLGEELETLTFYLELEKLRLGDRLNYHFEIDERIDLTTTQIPLLLLQPFLENAIWHGIHPKAEGGTLLLKMTKQDNRIIRIVIQDDGVGRSAKQKASKQDEKRRSWGNDISDQSLKNFNRRRWIPVELSDGPKGIGTQVVIYLTERRYNSKVVKNTIP